MRFGSWETAFYEGNSGDYTFFFPHDFARLIELSGGAPAFAEKLEHGLSRGLISYANEPAFLSLRAFHYALRPDLAAKWVRSVLTTKYTLHGYPGNDDSGAMASWYVFGALGLFPNAGQPIYLLSGPMFPRVTLALANGRSFVIEALDASRDNLYIQGCTLRDQPLEHAWLTHAEIMSGGTLRCAMGPAPSGFGTSGEPPPSLSTHGIP